MTWKGITLVKANELLEAQNIKIIKNEQEGNYIAVHPDKNVEVIRRPNITETVKGRSIK